MREMIMELLLVIIQVIVVAVGGYFLSWIKEKIGETNYNKTYTVVKKIVQAVEQEFGALLGEERKCKAITMIRQRLGDKLSEEEITTLIEAAVFEMNLILKPKTE